MIKENITIINKLGLHARAAAKFVTHANKFSSKVEITKGSKTVNGKSIMGVMMLAASKGTDLVLQAEGSDESDAIAALKQLVNDRFGEAE